MGVSEEGAEEQPQQMSNKTTTKELRVNSIRLLRTTGVKKTISKMSLNNKKAVTKNSNSSSNTEMAEADIVEAEATIVVGMAITKVAITNINLGRVETHSIETIMKVQEWQLVSKEELSTHLESSSATLVITPIKTASKDPITRRSTTSLLMRKENIDNIIITVSMIINANTSRNNLSSMLLKI